MGSTKESTRSASLAGSWYPASSEQCEQLAHDFEREAVPSARQRAVTGIIPHAGWVFSGSVAYNVMRELARLAGDVETVVLFAGHLRPSSPATVMTHGSCWTPYGPLETDEPLARALATHPGTQQETPEAHSQDNSAEVEFPLIKRFFPQSKLVVVGAPPHSDTIALADAVVAAAERLGRSIVALGSTDLTHYGPNYFFTPHGMGPEAQRWVAEVNDPLFIDAICQGSSSDVIDVGLEHHNACCPGAVAAAMRCGERLGQRGGERLRYATSNDIRPDDSFVGYTGVLL